MIKRDDIIRHLGEYLGVENFEDYCVNGLQIEGNEDVSHVITGVSVSERLFNEAIRKGAQLIIVHHGLFWKRGTPSPFHLTGLLRKRVKLLLDHEINLAAYHLPLDAHPDVGNNACILKSLNIEIKDKLDIGFWGELPKTTDIEDFRANLNEALPDPAKHLDFGPPQVKKIGVVSGGASTMIEDVHRIGMDAFISGDIQEQMVRIAEELGIHYFAAGHYNSERFGPIALADHLQREFKIPVEFVEVPNDA